MAEPFVGEIRLFSFPIPPSGWALCDGRILPVNENQVLFTLLGFTYGGNGTTTFALPDLRGRTPVHMGNNINQGDNGGVETYTLNVSEMPLHNHQAMGSSLAATNKAAVGQDWAKTAQKPYGTATASPKSGAAVALATSGASQGHQNMQPFTVVNYCIALIGMWPSQN